MSTPISAFVNAYNEEDELPSLFENLKGVDEIVIIDHQSTDNTAKIARELGAVVITRESYYDIVKKDDVSDFKKRYKLTPHFVEGEKLGDGSKELNTGIQYCKNDWVLWIDCDERVTWDLPEVKKHLKEADVIKQKYISIHNDDGSPRAWFENKKLFRKSKTWFVCRTHTIINGNILREVFTDKMQIDHYQKPKEYRKEYLKYLEYAFLKEQSSRMNFYLAREYFHASEFEKSLQFFHIYLKNATYLPEIGKAYTLMSGCLWQLGKREDSFIALFQSMRVYPYSKMTFTMMANLIEVNKPEDAGIWRKFSEILGDEHF